MSNLIDLNNIAHQSKLPFFYLPNLNLKVLIDSGATDSIINPNAAENFINFYYKEPFSVTSMNRTSISQDNIKFPLLKELGINSPLKLRVIDWHKRFDVLIGTKDLEKFKAQIDYDLKNLKLNEINIPFYLEYNSKEVSLDNINAKVLKIPVNIESGEVILPPIKLKHDVITPECIVKAHNGICSIPNPLENEKVSFRKRVETVPVNVYQVETPEIKQQKFPKVHELIRTDHLNSEEKKAIIELCIKFRDVFYYENTDLTFTNKVKHKIRTTSDNPVYVKSFRHPRAMQEEIQNQIQKLLDNKIIRPSISPYSAPVWIVPKKMDASGKRKYRMVIDFRKLNEITVEDKYPLPRIDEILDNLGKCVYFTTLDLAQGFHQIELDSESIEKTAFTVNNGHYEYLRMPFGLKNAPATFQRMMDEVLKDYLYKFCFVYMDDVVIFSKSLQEHLLHIRQIFSRLKEVNLKVQLDKSEFLCKEVAFLGHVITPEGIKPNPSKIEAIQKYPIPKTTKEIKAFLGLIGYYRRFIANFANITSPMTKCLKKEAKIDTNDPDYLECFHLCKDLLVNAPILKYPDFSKPFKLTTDASNIAIGGVLSQNNQPIGYYSRTLNSAERNYSTIEKELLAILDSTKHFRPYLYGRRFTIETDHNPLVWLSKIKEPNSRLIRWKLKLEEFDFEIVYKKGKENKVADALSRIEIHNDETETKSVLPEIHETPDITDEELEQLINQNPTYNPTDEEIEKIINEIITPDPNIVIDLDDILLPSNPESDDNTVHSVHNEDDGKIIPITDQPVNNFSNRIILMFGKYYEIRFKQPFKKNHYTILIRNTNLQGDIQQMFKEIFRPNMTYAIFSKEQELIKAVQDFSKTFLNNNVKIFISTKYHKDILKEEEQKDIITSYHSETHTGINETYSKLRSEYFWPNMKDMIVHEINTCDLCLQAKYERNPYNVKLGGPLLAKKPFDTIHLDTFTFQNCKFLTIIDSFSKYAQAYYVKDGTGITILNKLRHYFSHHNYPKRIVCDEGREFFNRTLKEYCNMHKIELHFTTVNNPNSNSPIERLHSTLVEKLRILRLKNPKETPQNQMITAILIYNQSIHSATGFTPFSLLYGPYEHENDFDVNLTIYEEYNNRRKQELIPFLKEVYDKTFQKEQKVLAQRNANREPEPEINTDTSVFVKKNKPGKTDPLYEKINVTNRKKTKIIGKSAKNKITNSHVRKIKRLRKVPSLQANRVDDAIPSTSRQTN